MTKKKRRGRPPGSKNKRGRPKGSGKIKGSTNWLENINILAKELEKELIRAIERIKGVV